MANVDKHGCAWCETRFKTATQHMIHVHEAHSDAIGRGSTRSRTWSCWRCCAEHPSTTDTCECGFVHPYMTKLNSQQS